MNQRIIPAALTALALILVLMISGCAPVLTDNVTSTRTGTPAQLSGPFVAFNSTEAYARFAQSHQSTGPYLYRGGVMMADSAAPLTGKAAPSEAGANAGAGTGSVDFSQTNVQVAGIDEADATKTDGQYIYTITDNTVFVLQAYPGQNASVVATFHIAENNYPSALLVKGNTLVVLGNHNPQNWQSSGSSYAYLYDISDKSKPTLKENLTFEGSYMDARLKDDYVYFFAVTYPQDRPRPMPLMYRNGVESQIPVDRIYYNPIINYQSPSLVTINGIKLSDASVQSTAVTVDSAQTLYMSADNIYLAYTQYINEYEIHEQVQQDVLKPYLTADDNSLIERINAVSDDILSSYEKKAKVTQVYYTRLGQLTQAQQNNITDEATIQTKKELAKYDYFEYTIINKLSYQDGLAKPAATGKVAGSLNNQFAMDESNGTLRVATTVHQHWSQYGPIIPLAGQTVEAGSSGGSATATGVAAQSSKAIIAPRPPVDQSTQSQNMVFTLDGDLNVLGSITNIAPGEQIYATRYDGDRLYLVTFRQVDPFFVVDLSDAKHPTIVGELKLPGFSRYLHPVGHNLVLGLGQDANADTGRVSGLKISLFDTTDVSNPREIASYKGTDQYAYSTALFDHHAFLLSMDKGLLVIPVQNYVYDDMSKNYAGALVFRIDNQSIALRGLVDHAKGSSDIWNSQVERSLYINDTLYTKSRNLVRINDLNTLASVKDIVLQSVASPDIPVY